MFGSEMLEVAICLALVYIILSLICSAVNEWIASRLGMRAKCLERAIKNLFNNPEKVKEFYKNPLIAGLSDGKNLPSYIPSGTFAHVLLDVIKPSDEVAGSKTFADLKDMISRLPECEIRSVLLNFSSTAQEKVENVRKDVENWFNSAMERASGWYKRKIQWIMLGISFVVCGFLNADSFTIANTLWRDDALRASIVASAQQTIKTPPSSDPNVPPKNIEELRAEIQKLNLPIGWVKRDDPNALKGDPRAIPKDIRDWAYKIFGILFTALAASQGAPFWFDLLNKFVDLRGVGKKPKNEKEKKDGSSGNPVK